MLLLLVRFVVVLAALVIPGGLLMLVGARILRPKQKASALDFDGRNRRVPDTRRGRHTPVML